MDLSLRNTRKFNNTLIYSHTFLNNTYNSPYHSRSKSFSQTVDYFDKNRENTNLSEIIKFIKFGKINSNSSKSLNIKTTENVILGKNDLSSILKKNLTKYNSKNYSARIKKYYSFDCIRCPKKFNKNNYVIENYNKVFSDFSLKNNKNDPYRREKILKNIFNTRNRTSHIKNNSECFLDKFWRLWDHNKFNPKKNLNQFYNENVKSEKCLIVEIKSLKSELQKDVNKQKSTIQPTYNNRKNNFKKFKSFREGRNMMEEFKDVDFYYQLSHTNNMKDKSKNIVLSNFKY